MERSWYIRCLFVLGVIAGAAYLLYPSYYYFAEASPQERDDHGNFVPLCRPGQRAPNLIWVWICKVVCIW